MDHPGRNLMVHPSERSGTSILETRGTCRGGSLVGRTSRACEEFPKPVHAIEPIPKGQLRHPCRVTLARRAPSDDNLDAARPGSHMTFRAVSVVLLIVSASTAILGQAPQRSGRRLVPERRGHLVTTEAATIEHRAEQASERYRVAVSCEPIASERSASSRSARSPRSRSTADRRRRTHER